MIEPKTADNKMKRPKVGGEGKRAREDGAAIRRYLLKKNKDQKSLDFGNFVCKRMQKLRNLQ